ncbi:hypothetical protein Dsin_001685 [Dipteronia sinensis]|uniref:RNase H type-1 domain-containing protein n=1 Tax=Dipteronia sinensis TaxID=43782 RepID=A0AAE0B640_9ROSI|nr:hypothetical protein Dsin_001685 [Dipteronia sinensis]
MVSWAIWEDHNALLNSGKAKEPKMVVDWVIGVTIRDDKGKVLVARSNLLCGSFSAEIGQFLALREGLTVTKFYNLRIQVAEVVSSKVISSLYSSFSILGDASFIINDVKDLLSKVGSYKCQSVSKFGNVLAQNLASLAFSARERFRLDPSLSCCSFSL